MNFNEILWVVIIVTFSVFSASYFLEQKPTNDKKCKIEESTKIKNTDKNITIIYKDKINIKEKLIEKDKEDKKLSKNTNFLNTKKAYSDLEANNDKFVVHFRHNTNITKKSIKIIENQIYPILNNSNVKVMITGYSDASRNKKITNKKLSIKRALIVKEMLIELGIKPEQLLTEGKGATNFIDSSKKSDIKNRRAEISIISLD